MACKKPGPRGRPAHLETESQFQARLVAAARKIGYLHYHPHSSKRSEPGFPDLTLCKRRLIFIECKTATGKLSPDQARWIIHLLGAGQEVYLARPEHYERIICLLAGRADAALAHETLQDAIVRRDKR